MCHLMARKQKAESHKNQELTSTWLQAFTPYHTKKALLSYAGWVFLFYPFAYTMNGLGEEEES